MVDRLVRQAAILERIGGSRSIQVVDLASTLGVSEATIRRDLQALSGSGLLLRTHGGAVANDVGDELPIRLKSSLRQEEKIRIGRAGADLVEDGTVVGMTGGTTALELARALSSRRHITVVTNALNIAAELVGIRGVHLVVIGGIARRSAELVGPAAEMMLAGYHLDVAFIGVDGLTAEHGCTTYDEMEAQTDRAFLRQARRAVVIADSSKIGCGPVRSDHPVVPGGRYRDRPRRRSLRARRAAHCGRAGGHGLRSSHQVGDLIDASPRSAG
ncbi:DeoR/GlpR family DNA-binding transcription regulator [Nakamurella sp. PAMC28650]|uniref:DeoR/GlpR family DNA-binding transcription regulator n=1 Tax=Nakamurella sp. PAMC28650 TaxID=2762325 RepID=UPI001C9AB647|nr:DeoR/GlpR family DNA-binding transcription regulator [Nakamurella sp. PAMC28650]